MRIIAGKAKGRKLLIPYEQGARPFLEQARGAIFNILNKKIKDSSVLDVYAGSGALGLEALSRGAGNACFIEREVESVKLLEGNIGKCGFENNVVIIQQDATAALNRIDKNFDIIFLDPPFADTVDWEKSESSFKIMENTVKILAENGTIVFRLEKTRIFPESWHGLSLFDNRVYGRSRICFYGAGF